MHWFSKIKVGIIALLLWGSSAALAMQDVVIYELQNKDFSGEADQIKGLIEILSSEVQENRGKKPEVVSYDLQGVNSQTFNLSTLKDIPPESGKEKRFFITSGAYGIEALRNLRGTQPNGIFVYVSHQILGNEKPETPNLKNLVGVADIIILPNHVFAVGDPRARALREEVAKSRRTTVIEIPGVLHTVHPEDIRKEFESHKQEIPNASHLDMVMLGGDLQGPDGKWRYYSPLEAKALGAYMGEILKADKELFLLVANGPRTGRFNPETGEEAGFHEKGDMEKGHLDPVTEAFMMAIPENVRNRVKLYNFEKNTPSLFKALLGAVSAKEGKAYMPGDSTSMISQATQNLKPGAVVIFDFNGLYDIHKAHMEEENKKGRVDVLKIESGKYEKITPAGAVIHAAEREWEELRQSLANSLKI